MKPLYELTLAELSDRVVAFGSCHNGSVVNSDLFTARSDFEFPSDLASRQQIAAEYCGDCSAQIACVQLAKSLGASSVKGSIMGGFYFGGNFVLNIKTNTKIPKSKFF